LAEYRYARKQEEFVSSITHEMKSPLAAIQLHAQTLQQDAMTGEATASVDYILRESDRLGRLIDNVLESSRLVARKHPLAFEPLPLRPMLEEFFAELTPQIVGQGFELDVDLATDAVVETNREALRRIITNLIDNAIQHSARGGRIRCRVEDLGGWVRIQVDDEGQGIPKSELSRIFERFHQVRRDRGSSTGTGLGLFIVSQLVDQMHGSVRAASHEDRPGASFVVDLPMASEE
jgi:signal transduction histidine kinase